MWSELALLVHVVSLLFILSFFCTSVGRKLYGRSNTPRLHDAKLEKLYTVKTNPYHKPHMCETFGVRTSLGIGRPSWYVGICTYQKRSKEGTTDEPVTRSWAQ